MDYGANITNRHGRSIDWLESIHCMDNELASMIHNNPEAFGMVGTSSQEFFDIYSAAHGFFFESEWVANRTFAEAEDSDKLETYMKLQGRA